MRARLFIDFWNFQLDWNRATGKGANGQPIRIPWEDALPRIILAHLSQKHGAQLQYDGTHVYASVDPRGDEGLRRFLHAMQAFPGYTTNVRERKANWRPIRCSNCCNEIHSCPNCRKKLRRTVEKGVDVAIVTEMIQMAHDDVYDVAVLGSSDADLCHAVTFIQERIGKRVYNLWFEDVGVDLRNTCWDHIRVQNLLPDFGSP